MSAQSPLMAPLDSHAVVWRFAPFDSLGVRELQYIYMARQAVFSVEQQCAFMDADGLDERAHHLAAWSGLQREPLAYARLLEPGVKYAEPSIGRVITTAAGRGRGLGREAMVRAIGHAAALWPGASIRISAQSRLEGFYASLGFVIASPRYLEDGIDHTEMVRMADVRGHSAPSPGD
ncbi:MAG TPA: GNAT family N-acetyltransferase [Caldimonas sp.]|nr:GNAT family N-acetyltransferase [Caldimonas sp.]